MYAIFESGGKQYRVAPGNTLEIEKLDVPVGETVKLADVLMIVDGDRVEVGTPTIKDAAVVCRVVEHTKGRKVHPFKSKKTKGYRRRIGHRQKYVKLHIEEIESSDRVEAQA